VTELENGIRAVVRDLVDAWRNHGAVDLAEDLAWPMPFDVFPRDWGRDPRNLDDTGTVGEAGTEYAEKRTTEGLSRRDIMRCLKRYIARELYGVLVSCQAA
jgi:hypothetical protein